MLIPSLVLLFLSICQYCDASEKRNTNGIFTFPSVAGTAFHEGQSINITWATSYTLVNLYLWQYPNYSAPWIIARGAEAKQWTWEVSPENQNPIYPFFFYAESTLETQEQQLQGAFGSENFYILPSPTGPTTFHTTISGTGIKAPSQSHSLSTTTAKTQEKTTSSHSTIFSSPPQLSSSGHGPSSSTTHTLTSNTASAIGIAGATKTEKPTSSSLSSGTKLALGLGLGLGLPLLIVLSAGVYYLSKIVMFKRKESDFITRFSHQSQPEEKGTLQQSYLNYEIVEVEAFKQVQELDTEIPVQELDAHESP